MNLALLFHLRRGAGRVVPWSMPPPPPSTPTTTVLADQLSVFQAGWANYAHQITAAPPPPDFWTFRCLWRGTWPKRKKAVGCLSSKKYSNHNYTHTLESSCLCQVAEINVALRGERAARVCKGAKEFLTRANDKSCLLENMKHIGLFMLVSFIPTKCCFYDKTEEI